MSGTEARAIIEAEVRRELFGPVDGEEPRGRPIDCSSGVIRFSTVDESRGQFHDQITKEEILTIGSPLTRYGIGVLHGGGSTGTGGSAESSSLEEMDLMGVPGVPSGDYDPPGPPAELEGCLRHDEADSDDFDLTDANSFKPSAMALSFQCHIPPEGSLVVHVTGAYYDKLSVHIPGLVRPVDWWLRRPFTVTGSVRGGALSAEMPLA